MIIWHRKAILNLKDEKKQFIVSKYKMTYN